MGTTDNYFVGEGQTDVRWRFWATGNTQFGGRFQGTQMGALGWVDPDAGKVGVVGAAGGDTLPTSPGLASAGVGVWGTSTTGPGVAGTSSNDAGVVGQSGDVFVSAGTAGVVGSSQNRPGVFGVSSASAGVVGVSNASNGVEGSSTAGIGVAGESSNSSGVVGISGAPPTANYAGAVAGVIGASRDHAAVYGVSDAYTGVMGISNAAGPQLAGVLGTSSSSSGVMGISDASAGVSGTSKSSVGVQGIGTPGVYGMPPGGLGVGVHGDSKNSFGVYGTSSGYIGVFGSSGQNWGPLPTTFDPYPGIWGTSSAHIGVLGTSNNNFGIAGYSTNAVGVYGESGAAGPNGYAGFFRGNLYVTGQIFAGTKDAIVPFSDGSHRLMHCMESPEHWFEDFGTARLKRGRAVVKLDADFAKTIKTGDYRVFLTSEGDCGGLYIKSKRGDGFEVRELQGGTSNVAFSYRVVGRRRDIKRHKRFARIDITPPMPITKSRTAAHAAARAQAVARKLRAAIEKHVAALEAKPARGRKVRSRRQRKARA